MIPPIGLIITRSMLSDESFAIFSVFVLINGIVMIADVGVTAAIFKHLSKYLAGSIQAESKVISAITVGKKFRTLAILLMLFYCITLVNQWGLGTSGWVMVAIFLLSAGNRWTFAILKTALFASQKSNFFYKVATLFSLSKYGLASVSFIFGADILPVVGLITLFSLYETYYLKSRLNGKAAIIFSNKGPVEKESFDYILGVSSLLWVLLIQFDKVFISVSLDQTEFGRYALFFQLCMGFFVISSTVYALYGSQLYGRADLQKKALLNSFAILGCTFLCAELLLFNPWLYGDFLESIGVLIFHDSVVIAYLILMLIQPLVVLLIDLDKPQNLIAAYFFGIAGWLTMAIYFISYAWLVQSLIVSLIILVSLRSIDFEMLKIIYKSIFLLLSISLFIWFMSLDSISGTSLLKKGFTVAAFGILPVLFLRGLKASASIENN